MNNISKERVALKLTQEALANRLGWRQSRLSNYENGIRKPGLGDCRRIVEALNLFGGDCTLDSIFPPVVRQNTNSVEKGAD
ncbi:helix-turn-helix transcriptional regulator [Enterobacter ludwigii]|uniref:helix-turn-helix transcriptional regulator n=1 Tax=Enterobacter ludwigii TaxID=299767 RepID=UPI0003D86E0B|nr:helix-turn-helix transcriptional regulator [Enterobacter ludwigii]AHE70418.1 XRE family transcriptional regulator [Enterobacter ludwigii]